MNRYFIITQKRDQGCPVGFTNAILCDKFYVDIKNYEYGKFDWYDFKGRPGALIRQFKRSGPLCLISMDKRYSFDIRGIGGREKMYAISASFLDVAADAGVIFDQLVEATFVDQKNIPLGRQSYKIATFQRLEISDLSDDKSTDFVLSGSHICIKKLKIRNDFDAAIFSIGKIIPQQDTPFCSARTKSLLEEQGIKGIEFTEVEDFQWPNPGPSSSTSDLLSLLTGEQRSNPML